MDAQEEKYRKMTEPPVEKLICRLAVPCIISMLVTAFYNMADTYFVGMLKSNAATGAVGVAFSMMAVIQAVGFFFGQGSGVYISRALGQKQYDDASTMAAVGFFSAMTVGAVICLAGQLFLRPLALFLGSTETILPYTMAYLRVILLGAPWMCASFVLNNQLRFQGSASYAMVGIVTGALVNIALDPILIFGLNLGVAGAGWATILSQLLSFFLLIGGTRRGGNIRLHIRKFRLKMHYYIWIFNGGLPSLARQVLASMATICLNNAALPYGDAAIAAMGVVQRVMMFGFSAMLGFGQGFQPVCGFNYGARLYSRVRKGFWFCVKVATLVLAVLGAAGFLFAPKLIAVFRDDPDVITYGTAALRFQCMTLWMQGWVVMSNMLQQATGKTVPATFLSVARQGLFFIPMVFILKALLGLTGIQLAQSAADTVTFLCAIPLQLYVLRHFPKDEVRPEQNG